MLHSDSPPDAPVVAARRAEFDLALSYARAGDRAALAALFALDSALGHVLRTTREPLVGQMRLTWWHEALTALDTRPVPGEPVLRALAADVLPRGVAGGELAALVEGWEVLLDADADVAAFGKLRGATLFALAGRLLGAGAGDALKDAGAGWALADLSRHSSDEAGAAHAAELARPLLTRALARRWSRSARPLGALTHLARLDLAAPPGRPPVAGSPSRIARLAWHRLTGR